MRFVDRRHAGQLLAAEVRPHVPDGAVVLGLPRGGVPVAAEVARAVHAPLDVLAVRKLGMPGHPELAIGAIGEGGVRIVDHDQVARAGVSEDALRAVEARARAELERQVRRYRGDRPPTVVRGRTVVIVDDGLATGMTARAAARVAHARGAARVLLAVPVAPPDAVDPDRLDVDGVLTVTTPRRFVAVGKWYDDFTATTDAEVVAMLAANGPGEHDDDAAARGEGQVADDERS